MANEVAKAEFSTALSSWSNTFTDLIQRDYEACGVVFDDYSKKCAMSAMTSIFHLVKDSGQDISKIDTSNLREVVEHCASLKLNANAFPRECYFKLVSKKVGNSYVKVVEMGIEGAGNDSILRNYGVDVAQVYPYWVVKEGDDFTYPKRKGIEVAPPEWEEKGLSQKCVRVVYPVKLKDGTITYLIAERESVKLNLFAHVKQNLLNVTFGIVDNKYDANEDQKKQIAAKKQEIYEALRKCETVDDMLACEIARPYMSGAWLDTPESMIVRKMCNNATKKFPKNYDAMASKSYMELDETYQAVQEDIIESANSVEFIENDENA